MIHRVLYTLLFCIFALGFYSCKDEDLYTADGAIPEGETEIAVQVDFEQLGEALTAKSRTAGNATKAIDNLCVLLYNESKQLAHGYYLNSGDFTVSNVKHTGVAEATTPKATFELKVPYGRYYIAVVANMGDVTANTNLSTISKLKSYVVDWNAGNVTANKQMLGYFNYAGKVSDAETLLTINKVGMNFSAKMRRLASKVTVRIDGSQLNDNIYVYVKSIAIHNIPASCPLGMPNTPKADADVIANGEAIMYDNAKGMEFQSWSRVTKGNPILGSDHSEVSEALYFFENLQGTGKSKLQDANKDGVIDYPNGNNPNDQGFRDGKKYGTYIEVDAYYVNNTKEGTSHGPIKYRFMLGKNITTDYNAERNHHYKLTLNLKNNANDMDWHIDYKEEPGIFVPQVYYVSYLNNEGSQFPVRISGNIQGNLSATIVESQWEPFTVAGQTGTTEYYRGTVYDSKTRGNVSRPGPCYGFLSLKQETREVVPGSRLADDIYNDYMAKDQGNRSYSSTVGTYGDYVVSSVKGSKVFSIPLYTRARNIVTNSGYTGCNPFVANPRKAVVKLSCMIDGKKYEKTVTVYQSRRIENPTGVFRKAGSREPFNCVMTCQKGESSQEFLPLVSEGPWSARLLINTDAIAIVDIDSSARTGSQVSGTTGSVIQFKIVFKGYTGPVCNVVEIKYHNYSCTHFVFIRQGYAPLQMYVGGPKWHTFNMLAQNRETVSPIDEGSLFKYDNWGHAIDVENNDRYGFNVDPAGGAFSLNRGTASMSWATMFPFGALKKDVVDFPNPEINGKTLTVASHADWVELAKNSRVYYGVCYADGASTVALNRNDVYGYRGTDGESVKGMRGAFVVEKKNGKMLFFPIGSSGYGHRQTSSHIGDPTAIAPNKPGAMRYAQRAKPYPEPDVKRCPLFWNLYKYHGAIYWTDRTDGTTGTSSWDLNYATYDFSSYSSNAWYLPTNGRYYSDAAFVRCVEW